MRTVDLILKKRAGGKLAVPEIEYLIRGIVGGEIPDYQAAAWLMAVCFQGMDAEETTALTRAMRDSGQIVTLEGIEGVKVDKHSTGGVGDKTTLVVGPLVAACGLKVAKMSGRGLGHTGGTLDKLEAIRGFRINLTQAEFVDCVNRHGIAVIGQTGDLVPADRKLYALRDATGTVESIPLIASSIMSKKLAVKNDVLVLDVKFGGGAFMKTLESGRELARAMVDIGRLMGLKTAALLTDMDQPLGWAVGNAMEVEEAMETLKGRGPADLMELALAIGAEHLTMGGLSATPEAARERLHQQIASGAAYAKFEEMVVAQGGDVSSLGELPKAPLQADFPSAEAGYVQAIDCLAIGNAAMLLGAGRETKESTIDLAVGLMMKKRIGARVEKGEPLVRLHYADERRRELAARALSSAFSIGPGQPPPAKVVHDVVRG